MTTSSAPCSASTKRSSSSSASRALFEMDTAADPGTFVPYEGLHVVEISTDLAGESTGKLLAQYGATVIKVEPPSGAPSRHVGPYANDQEDPEHSLTYWFYNASKRSQVLELPEAGDREHLERLLAG